MVAHDQVNRWFLDPVAGRGYPEDTVRAWGWRRDEVLDGDMELIAAPIDFLGVNYYCRHIVRSPLPPGAPAGAARGADGDGLGGLPGRAHGGARVRRLADRRACPST